MQPMKKFFLAAALLVTTSCVDCTQFNRSDRCNRVLLPPTCDLLVEKQEYQDYAQCHKALMSVGFCDAPIYNTIVEIDACAAKIKNATSLPPECAILTHEKTTLFNPGTL
jgi:hypothetical protein